MIQKRFHALHPFEMFEAQIKLILFLTLSYDTEFQVKCIYVCA